MCKARIGDPVIHHDGQRYAYYHNHPPGHPHNSVLDRCILPVAIFLPNSHLRRCHLQLQPATSTKHKPPQRSPPRPPISSPFTYCQSTPQRRQRSNGHHPSRHPEQGGRKNVSTASPKEPFARPATAHSRNPGAMGTRNISDKLASESRFLIPQTRQTPSPAPPAQNPASISFPAAAPASYIFQPYPHDTRPPSARPLPVQNIDFIRAASAKPTFPANNRLTSSPHFRENTFH